VPATRRSARAVLAVGVVLGLGAVGYRLAYQPSLVGADFAIYVGAAEALLAGEAIYGVPLGSAAWAQYLYPPGTIPAFVPFLLLPEVLRFPTFLAFTIAAGIWGGHALTRSIDRWGGEVEPIDRVLITGFVLISSPVAPTQVTGNVNGVLVVATIAGVVAVERARPLRGGVALALAASVKLFPAAVLAPWLLVRRRWRTVAAATATGLGVLVFGLLVLGVDGHARYVADALLNRPARVSYAGGMRPSQAVVTFRRPLSVIFPRAPRWSIVAGAFIPVIPVTAALWNSLETRVDELVTLLGTGLAVLVALPALVPYLAYLTVAFVPLLYLLPAGEARRYFLPGVLLVLLPIQLDDVRTVAELVASSATAEAAVGVLRPVLSLATPPLFGVALVVTACLLHRWRRVSQRSE
jgi:hypothetical protein